MQFTRQGLEQAGFVGWMQFEALRADSAPSSGGVYVVTYQADDPITFADRSCGGWFKGKDPTVTHDDLIANWVDDAEVVYIGKANALNRRLTQYADFGAGKLVGHWGGRLIWQLSEIHRLRVAWKETPGRIPAEVEKELLIQFSQVYGKPPFANSPQRLGR